MMLGLIKLEPEKCKRTRVQGSGRNGGLFKLIEGSLWHNMKYIAIYERLTACLWLRSVVCNRRHFVAVIKSSMSFFLPGKVFYLPRTWFYTNLLAVAEKFEE